jgi:MFS family permease
MPSRILLGISADLWMKPRIQLAAAGIATAVCCLAMIAITPQWSPAAITALCVLFGTLSFAWNGVFHAETASIAPAGQIGRVTGGMQVFVSAGAMGGPALFSLILALTDSFAVAFFVLALPTLAVGCMFLAPAHERIVQRAAQ